MADSQLPSPPVAPSALPKSQKPRWGLRLGLGAAALVFLALAFLAVRLFLPVWWATRVTNQTQGSLSGGLLLGLAYGFIFTFVPLLIGWQARYKKITWTWKAVILGVAVLAAIPNLLTLGIYLNSSSAAAKARLMIDTSAIWFPSWTLGGAIAGLVLFAGIAVFWQMWRSRGRKMRALQQASKTRAAAPVKVADAASTTPSNSPAGSRDDGEPSRGPGLTPEA